ncbi:hypothetical protein S144_49 [Shewanella sp. phage 1/44]|uniref:hypothetical protein n=1 Tax=Shewanella sp. phage 1/44 TaxID=1458862 RepID=UPI0004F8870F|nr:hypothetical protein S144_49 [Shewanella sp. phage 1/44]AHK11763.1 hypothetical protein S144_49 [Shewanella sp. phage 1/44]
MDLTDDELSIIEQGLYAIEQTPEHLGELATHELLLGLDVDELYYHLTNFELMSRFEQAQEMVHNDINDGMKWGSIYE